MDMQIRSLRQMLPGEQGIVREITVDSRLRSRLYAMGFTPGTTVEVCPACPFAEGRLVRLRGGILALDEQTAAQIHCALGAESRQPVVSSSFPTNRGSCAFPADAGEPA